jgi:2-polyprenyl-6-methoxyphenol hydroxylase-like FAD-dependent oxidoreductase
MQGEYNQASPSETIDLPQTLLEPILMRYATLHGFKCRWDSKFVSFIDDKESGTVITTALDKITQKQFKIRSKYLFGADGARSQIVQQLGLPMDYRPPHGWAVNVLVEADLTHLMKYRMGNLHWVLQPDSEHPEFARVASLRMIKPWTEWIAVVFPLPGVEKPTVPHTETFLKLVREFIGDPSIPVKLLGISYYDVNDSVAESFSRGNV